MVDSESQWTIDIKMPVPLRFQSPWEEDLDKVLTATGFILKHLDYSCSISMRDGWLRLRPHQLSRSRNLELIM